MLALGPRRIVIHANAGEMQGVLFERLASRVLGTDGSLRATADAIAPAFLFLAACEFAALIAIFAYRREPHGKPMEIG